MVEESDTYFLKMKIETRTESLSVIYYGEIHISILYISLIIRPLEALSGNPLFNFSNPSHQCTKIKFRLIPTFG